MRRLLLLLAIAFCYVACNQDKVPKGIIEKNKMLDVLLDMQLSDAALNQVYNSDTMKMQAKSRYQYVFKKYKIDSALFTNSLKYYSENPVELDSMYSIVSDSLTRLQQSLKPKKVSAEGLYSYVFKGFTSDSPKFNSMDYYNLDAKKLYKKHNLSVDSLTNLKDSLQIKQTKEFRKNDQIKNDLSAK